MKNINCKIVPFNEDEDKIEKKINSWLDNHKTVEILEVTVLKHYLIVFYQK